MEKFPVTEPPSLREAARFAWVSAEALLHNIPGRPGVEFRPVYEENARSAEIMPLNVEEEVLPSFMDTLWTRHIKPGYSHTPYWETDVEYDTLEVFGSTIQSLDLHDAPLPKTVLPPQEDIAKFINEIKDLPFKANLNDQLNVALDITGNDILGAVNVCWIATRFMARGADQRAYPDLFIDADAIRAWNSALVQFETYNNSGQNDAPGDTYYFWTHVFAAMAFSNRGVKEHLARLAFSRGTQIMAFVRKNLATGNQPNITAHQPASRLGRHVGLAPAHFDRIPNEYPEFE